MKDQLKWNKEMMIEVQINPDDFNIIRETLTRIGISSKNSLYQTCHIFHKKGKYYIVHFKELFALNGKEANLSTDDVLRRNYIAGLLETWGLVKIVNPEVCQLKSNKKLRVLPYSKKHEYELVPKYNLKPRYTVFNQ